MILFRKVKYKGIRISSSEIYFFTYAYYGVYFFTLGLAFYSVFRSKKLAIYALK